MPLHPAPVPPVAPSADLAALIGELDDLTRRASLLRARLAHLETPSGGRPGWPIRRLAKAPADPTRA
jgi:hypothetical protein